jgi:hypothetical protein
MEVQGYPRQKSQQDPVSKQAGVLVQACNPS